MSKKSSTAYLAALVILVGCLAPTIHSYSLRKAGERDLRKDADAATATRVQEGKIIFGNVFEKGSRGNKSHVVDGPEQASSSASVEDQTAYQADYAGRKPFISRSMVGCPDGPLQDITAGFSMRFKIIMLHNLKCQQKGIGFI